MATGNIAKWRKQEGDALNPGDVIAEVETDKATVDFECQDSGFLAKIIVPGATNDVPVGKVVAIMVDSKDAADAFKGISAEAILASLGGGAPAAAAAAPAKPAAAAAPAAGAAAPAAAAPAAVAPAPAAAAAAGGRVAATPYAKKVCLNMKCEPFLRECVTFAFFSSHPPPFSRSLSLQLAADAGISINAVAGTGPGGRIVAADVKEYKPPVAVAAAAAPAAAAAAAPAAAPAAATASAGTSAIFGDARSGFKDIPHSSMRRVIAHRLTASKQTVPHYYLTSDVQLDALLALRATLNADLPADGKISVNDFLIKASALACKKVPEVNSSWLDGVVRAYDYVDVSVAVAIPDGLITPVIRDAHAKGLVAISRCVRMREKDPLF